ncbi:MAG TPA: response regulator, partial [Thermoanaerobaculia bacterium]|nr:response regulator [Thermoanaerobaculia bacterium]
MRRLAIIEDDAAYTHELRAALEPEGFRTECFDDAARALAEMRSRAFLLAILDLGVRDVDPFAVCREASGLAPLITVTAECGEEICVRAFESGADDC